MKLDVKVAREFLAAVMQRHEKVDSRLFEYIEPEFFELEEQGGTEAYVWLARHLEERKWVPFPFDFLDQLLLSITDEEKRYKYRNQL